MLFLYSTALPFPATADPTPPASPTNSAITIGWTGPLTGNSAVLGADSKAAVEMIIAEENAHGGINGHPLRLAAEDDSYETGKAITAFSRLVDQEHAVAVIASTYGGLFAAAPIAEKKKVILIDALDCNDDLAALPSFTFCVATQSESVAQALAKSTLAAGYSSALFLVDAKNPFMTLVARNLAELLHPKVKFEISELLNPNEDVKPILTKQRAAQAIFFLGHDPMGRAMAEARALGSKAQFYTVGTITSPGFQSLAGAAAEGALVAYWEAPRGSAYDDFIREFTQRTGHAPALELATLPSIDAVTLLIRALREAVPPGAATADPDRLKRSLLAVKDFEGLSGKITVDSDGAVRSLRERIFVFRGGRLAPLD